MDFKSIVTTVVGVVLTFSMMIGCGRTSHDAGTEPVTLTFDVGGMTCESCEQAIIHTVGQLDGVDMVESHYDPGSATVLYRPGEVTKEEIAEVIEGMGYTVAKEKG